MSGIEDRALLANLTQTTFDETLELVDPKGRLDRIHNSNERASEQVFK
jgi:hypothetical protein